MNTNLEKLIKMKNNEKNLEKFKSNKKIWKKLKKLIYFQIFFNTGKIKKF